ncbi:beta strand repeat-containing protein [Roseibium aestuarii]|uniref:Beta strand repeat-containing protein n=1 Tax=Roseibium aestuarii TaxID=2600299 RepID=A0ABW4JW66_9HYPH
MDGTENTVAENSAGGTAVGITAFAEDADATDTVTYSITDTRFDIDPTTGVVTVADGAVLDAETTSSIDLVVTATSTDGSTSQATFTITISDENEFAIGPVSDVDGTENTVAENSAGGTVVGITAFAEDADATDTVTYSITDTRFVIDPNTGVVTVADGAVLDAETTSSIDLVVTATSTDGSTSQATFTITISDENEFAIGPVSDVDGTANRISASATGGTNTGLTALASDQDVSDTVSYSIDDARFVIDPTTGVVTVADGAVFDANVEPTVTVTVTATSTDGSSSTQSFDIEISEPVGPVSDVDASANTVAENSAGGTVVGLTAFANDPNPGDTVTYSITDARFVIDPNTGVVTVADGAEIDFEATPTIDLEVTATSTDGSSSSAIFTINVSDVNEDISTVVDTDTGVNAVAENGTGGEYVGITAFASDPDAVDTVTYSITDARFVIDPTTGVVTVADGVSFDHEATPTVDLEVTATSSDGSTATETFTVTITDVNEAPDLVVNAEMSGQEFLVNGSFEVFAGMLDGTPGQGWYENPDSIEGWDSYTNVDVHQSGHYNFGATDGSHHLDLSARQNGTISQTIEGQLDGHVYELSMDLKSRGAIGESVAEIYWNGELLATIDPAVTGVDWQTFTFNVVGGAGDGTNTLTFVEIGTNNLAGTLIDSVSIQSGSTISVAEEYAGAEIVALSVVDPDDGDSHSFTVSDDRFEVVATGSGYMLKLKDDQAFDYETEQSVTVIVTVTDSGGLSDAETIQIEVRDVNEWAIGPLTDVDASANVVAENSAGGTVVGITAFAEDQDGTDTVTYSITDTRFVIDANTGVITVADGAVLDAEATSSIDIEVTATSSDGSSVTETFTVNITDVNEFAIGPLSDVDASANLIAEGSAGGTVVGITAFAQDPDASDTVTYSITDTRFVIDANTGEITLADGVDLDFETTPSIDLLVTATSSDGSTSSRSFTINVGDVNEAPDLVVGDPVGSHNYIVNGSFEQFQSSGQESGYGNSRWYGSAIVNGWSTEADIHSSGWDNNLGTTDGDYRLDLANASNNGYAYQDVQGLADGETYRLSFDLRHRGEVGDAVVRVFWGGVLVAEIAPLATSSDWQSYAFEVTGGAGDGTDRLRFEEVGTDNYKGTQIDSVSLVDVSDITVAENREGEGLVALSVVDPDAGDTHTFTLSDSRFEVVVSDGAYLLKLKDGIALDYESEPSVTVTVTATDSGGLSDTEVIEIRVIDLDDGSPIMGTEEFIHVGDTTALNLADDLTLFEGVDVSVGQILNGDITLTSLLDVNDGLATLDAAAQLLADTGDLTYNALTGVSGALSFDFDRDISSVSFEVSDLYSGLLGIGTERGSWEIYDDGVLVGSGSFSGTGSGMDTINIDTGVLFDQVVLTADASTLGLGSTYTFEQILYTDVDLTVGGNDTLHGSTGDDQIYGLSGQDTIYGHAGDDLIVGGTRDDTLYGGDGSDTFLYQMGDGDDTIHGGAGASWIDMIDLNDGAQALGTYGSDWSVTVTDGSITGVDMVNGEISLSDDAAGYIDLADGSRIDFTEIESIQF